MMAASENTAQIKAALHRHLQNGRSTPPLDTGVDLVAAQALEAKITDALAKHPFLPKFSLANASDQAATETGAENMIALVYVLEKSEKEAWIELPVNFVKAVFINALGGDSNAQTAPVSGPLTAVEQRFAGFLAQLFCAAVTPFNDKAAFDRIVPYDPAGNSGKPDKMQEFPFVAPFGAAKTIMTIHLPLLAAGKEAVPSVRPKLANAAGRLVVAAEVRLKLSEMTLTQVAGLKRGDVIGVNAAHSTAQILIDHKAIFACELGKIGDHYSARVKGPAAASTLPQTDHLQARGN